MSVLAFIAFMGLAHAVGLYNPHVIEHGKCIAEPGSYGILLCPPETWPNQPKEKKR